MKTRILALLLAMLMVFALVLAGCKETVTPDGDDPGVTKTEDPAATKEPEVRGIDIPADRYDATETPRTGNNATRPFVYQFSELDGKFSPFFYTSAYDGEVVDMTSMPLLGSKKNGEVDAGIDVWSAAYDYEVTQADDASESTYKFWLKNGLTFSDGTPLTMEDVLFSFYVYLDPAYDGISTVYSLDIKGLAAYRARISDDVYANLTAAVEAAGAYDPTVEYAEGEYWSYLQGEAFAKLIYDEVNNTLQAYAPSYYGKDYADFTEADKIAFSMVMWGFGEPNEDYTIFTGASETEYEMESLTLANYWEELWMEYEDLDAISEVESPAGESVVAMTTEAFMAAEGEKIGGAAPTSIAGITTGSEVCDDGHTRDYIQFELNGVSPIAIFNLGIVVSPWGYYTKGFEGELTENHVSINDPAFMQVLKDKNSAPMGAGPYVFQDFTDNVVTMTANDSFALGSPKIATMRMKVVEGGQEHAALQVGDIDYSSTTSATPKLVTELSAKEGDNAKLSYVLVDNDGFGYITVQGQRFPDWRVRKAIAHALNVELTVSDYYGELATANYRTMTMVQWAYPENAENLYPYDATGETSKALFIEAGFTYDEAKNVMYYPEDYSTRYPHLADLALDGKPVTIKATLPYEASEHPAGNVFLAAQNLFATIGITMEIEIDTDVLDKFSTAFTSGLELFAAAWGSGGVDPDMYQIWYSDPAVNSGTSPAKSGLFYLFENGSDEEKAALVELNELIMQGNKILDPEQRKPIYARALEISTGMAVEIPTYQRKNIFIYNDTVLDGSTLLPDEDITPFWNPLFQRIWNVELIG